MVVVEPGQLDSLGFRLSVAASLALVIVMAGMMAMDGAPPLAGVLTATVAAQLATLPVLLPAFGTISLTGIPANIIAVPLVAIAMPLASLGAIAGLVWPPLGEMIAAPAALAATALIRTIDVLGAPEANVGVGVPPLPAAAAIAATASVLLLLIAGGAFRGVAPFRRQGVTNSSVAARTRIDLGQHVEHSAQPEAPRGSLPVASEMKPLPSLALVAREDPFDALAAHLEDPEEHPTSEEEGHEVADHGKCAEAVSGDIGRQLPVTHLGEEQEPEHHAQ